ncbi:hypothetical protein [Methanogenium organophilum]|nr:hypothetical protein [Methanogenium organophilum]
MINEPSPGHSISAENKKGNEYTFTAMADMTEIEIIGFSDGACGPFPCDETRTCELSACAPSENLVKAFAALKDELEARYPDVTLKLTLLDDEVPAYVVKIVEDHQPPLPIVLINGTLTPVGRISLPLITEQLERLTR